MASLSRQFAQWVVGMRYQDLPADVVDRAKGVTLHCLTSVLMGYQSPPGRQAVKLVTEEEAGVRNGATIMVDGGKATKAAEYSLTDDTYAKLLAQLASRKFDQTTPELRDDILHFYSDLSVLIETKKDDVRWQSVLVDLEQLKLVTQPPVLAGIPAK